MKDVYVWNYLPTSLHSSADKESWSEGSKRSVPPTVGVNFRTSLKRWTVHISGLMIRYRQDSWVAYLTLGTELALRLLRGTLVSDMSCIDSPPTSIPRMHVCRGQWRLKQTRLTGGLSTEVRRTPFALRQHRGRPSTFRSSRCRPGSQPGSESDNSVTITAIFLKSRKILLGIYLHY